MKKNTFLLTVVGTFSAVVLTVIYACIMTGITKLSFSVRLGDEASFALIENTVSYIPIGFFIFEIIFFVWLFSSLAQDKNSTQDAKLLGAKITPSQTRLSITNVAKISAVIGVIILISLIIVNVNVYTEFTPNVVKDKTFFKEKEYSYADVYRYSFSCDENATLKYTVQMRDGTSFELLQTTNSCSDKFIEEYGDMLSFAGYLSEKFDSGETTVLKEIKGIEYMKEYYGNTNSTWNKLNKIIGNAD